MKKKLYLVLSILTIIFLLSSAAICNLGQTQSSEEGQSQDIEESNTSSNKSSEATTASTAESKSSADNKDNQSQSSSKSSQNSPPEITDLSISEGTIFTGSICDVLVTAIDQDGDNLSYEWSADGGTFDDISLEHTEWTAPPTSGTYNLTVVVNDGKGGSDSKTKTVRVEEMSAADNSPVISDIENDYSGNNILPTNSTVHIIGHVSDPNNDIKEYSFSVTGGNLSGQMSNEIDWDTPSQEGTYRITLTVTDQEGNTATRTEEVNVVEPKG